MKFLVTGASGQVGMEVVRAVGMSGERDTVVALSREALDVGNRDAVMRIVTAERPDAVLNCAARTAVDACESDPTSTFRVNTSGVVYLAEACAKVGAHLTTISTDYVFDGTKRTPYTENDPPNPLSVYGKSKLAAEKAVCAAGAGVDGLNGHETETCESEAEKVVCGGAGVDGLLSVTVVRTSLVCGAYGSNMVKTVLSQLRSGEKLRYVTDQVASPTFAFDLAEGLLRLARKRWVGLLHVANEGAVSRFELACAIAVAAGIDKSRVSPITTAELVPPRADIRPAYSVLSCEELTTIGEPAMRHFTRPLHELVKTLT